MTEGRLKEKVNEIDYLKNKTEGGEQEGKMTGHLLHSCFRFYKLWSVSRTDCKVVVSDRSED